MRAREVLGDFRRAQGLTEEQDCDQHTFKVRVVYAPGGNLPIIGSPAIVAAHLRVQAQHVDGFCAFRDVLDEDLMDPGVIFHFTSDENRQRFQQGCEKYLRRRLYQALQFTFI
ncbi:hypothetical protein [Methylobacterium aquaticum]|uniref:hypothetical protein n=1 Tax=Methylobacterium aquaticum TaxID=270351 RepID=UPI001934433E|nr:hypothetical protein [Methylobacterium aquaticum]QRE78248.1 hypothetical protein F1D61_33005 [Methylobacterium aquaticum]QRE78268.1 hypothetical protein F1D61_33115 [Methylobacterium aquaticum]